MSLPNRDSALDKRSFSGTGENLLSLFFPEDLAAPEFFYAKETLMRSPLIVGIFPNFQVSLSKPVSGLTSTSLNDEVDQTLQEPQTDSFFGEEMVDDDDMWDLHDPIVPVQAVKKEEQPPAKIEVLAKASSLVVADVEYALPAGVKSVVVIPHNSINAEDSLLISLTSGYSLLVRVWRVPRGFSDALFSVNLQAEQPEFSHVFRPFVVQWWKLSSSDETSAASASAPTSTSSASSSASNSTKSASMFCDVESGFSLSAHPSGLAVVSASAHSLLRIHSCENTPAGLQLSPHFNVPINGVILGLCFAHPLNALDASNHILFLTLTLSTLKRLELSLYSWYAYEPLEGNLETSVLPLNNNFPFPIMIIPLANNNSFLLVCPVEFIIVTVNNIWSADYSFSRFPYEGAFPTAFSIPETSILAEEETGLCDELLIASDDGIVYLVIVQDNKTLEYVPIIRVADPISVFSLEKTEDKYILSFSSDTGGAKKIHIQELFLQTGGKMPYTVATLCKDYRNWTPVVDVLIIDSVPSRSLVNDCLQELWMLTGVGKRTKLSHVSLGYLVKKDASDEELRKAQALFPFRREGKVFVACCLPFETSILGPEMETIPLQLSESHTLWCANVTPEVVVQITQKEVLLTNISGVKSMELDVVFAKTVGNWAVVITEGLDLQIRKIEPAFEDWLPLIFSAQLLAEASALSVYETEESVLVLLGTFDGVLSCMALKKGDNSTQEILSINLDLLVDGNVVPHDILYFPETKRVYLGSKSGQFLALDSNAVLQNLQLGNMPLKLLCSLEDPNFILAYARNVWLFNFYVLPVPSKVSFGDKVDKPVLLMAELPSDTPQNIKLVLAKEDGLTVGTLFTHKTAIVKQISVGEPAKKAAYLDSHGLFILLSKSKNPLTRLKFAERKNYKMLPTVEFDSRSGIQRVEPIFSSDEYPTCCLIWRILRGDRVSKKVIVGSLIEGKGGNLKILDVSKVVLEGTQTTIIKQVELISIHREQLVTCIEQIGSTILFACGSEIYSTAYKLESKKLKPAHKLVSLSSDVTYMNLTEDSVLLVNTKMDSLLAFRYTEDGIGEADQLEVLFKDHTPRSLVHNSAMGKKYVAGDKLHSQLVILDPSAESSKFQLSMIPRTFSARFSTFWATSEKHVVTVGVNGEVVSFRPGKFTELEKIQERLALVYALSPETPISDLLERLARPFSEKVTGKGFHSLNKPFFDYLCNKDNTAIVNFDLEELSSISESGVVI